jgi:environmental stress-induced protein Ves
MQIIKHNQQQTVDWSGGKTTQLFIYPADAHYAERNFLFRISTATVETESSTFTNLKGYQRIIMLLQGELTLTHNNEVTHHLKPFNPHLFDGAWQTNALGKVTDFNVMFKPQQNAVVEVLTLTQNQQLTLEPFNNYVCYYLVKGKLTITRQNETENLDSKDLIVTSEEVLDALAVTETTIIKVILQL